jgi:NAD(P)-dependent dehydrogenase (short-subunit alcohol dehydrogenase family)
VATDVTREEQVAAAVAAGVQRFGRLDGAFNNAGISGVAATRQPDKAATTDPEAWDRVLAVNLTGVWRCIRHEIQCMRAAGHGGSIVNTASIAGLVGLPGYAAYAASKHGVVGLTRTAAAEYAKDGIRINAICPGFVETPMTSDAFARNGDKLLATVPQRRLGSPAEIAEAVVWLHSDQASFMTGACIAADGGYTAL